MTVDAKHQPETLEAVEELVAGEFPMPRIHPEHRGEDLPRDMDQLSDVELGNHLGIWASMFSRSKWELALAESDKLTISSRLRWIESTELAKHAGKKITVAFVKAEVAEREDVRDLTVARDAAEIKVKLLDALCDGFSKKYDAVSREISRRQADRRQSSGNPDRRGRQHYERVQSQGQTQEEPEPEIGENGRETYTVGSA